MAGLKGGGDINDFQSFNAIAENSKDMGFMRETLAIDKKKAKLYPEISYERWKEEKSAGPSAAILEDLKAKTE